MATPGSSTWKRTCPPIEPISIGTEHGGGAVVRSSYSYEKTAVPGLIEDLQLVLLKQIVTDEHTDLGILAHPLLSLILASGEALQAVSSAFIKKQAAVLQESVSNAFHDLMKGVERNLEVENRRKFLRNVQAYRAQVPCSVACSVAFSVPCPVLWAPSRLLHSRGRIMLLWQQ